MIAKTLVFVCAALGLAAGSCFDFRAVQESSPQYVSVPIQESSFSSDNSAVVATPVLSENVFSSGSSSSSPVISVVSSPSVSDNSFSEILSSGSSSGSSFGSSSFGVQAGNGPEATPVTVVQAPEVTLPAVEGPVVTLSSDPIPAPRVLAQRCICTKTIVKPQIIQRQVTVPKLQRYIKRTVTPIVENVSYRSTPISQGSSSSSSIVIPGSSSVSGSSTSIPVTLSSGSSSSSPVVFSSGSSSSSSPVVFSSGSGSSSSQGSYISSPVVVSSGSSSSRYY